jgi:hypothetical protein
MGRTRRHLSQILIPLWCAVAATLGSSAGFAAVTHSTTLSPGQTTYDGELTLEVTTLTNGSLTMKLKNNVARTVVVDAYALSPSDPGRCSGRDFRIAGNAIRYICNVSTPANQGPGGTLPREMINAAEPSAAVTTKTPEPNLGHASFQMSLIWHELPRPSPAPSSSTSPFLTPVPSPK